MIGKLLTCSSLAYVAGIITNHLVTKNDAFDFAGQLVESKGIINLGSGTSEKHFNLGIPYSDLVALNVDISLDGLPKFQQLDLEMPLPFADKQFDVSFASHVLEHLDNWKAALSEWGRISDYTVIVLPSPISVGNIFNPDHKQYFSYSDMEYIRKLPNTFVFC